MIYYLFKVKIMGIHFSDFDCDLDCDLHCDSYFYIGSCNSYDYHSWQFDSYFIRIFSTCYNQIFLWFITIIYFKGYCFINNCTQLISFTKIFIFTFTDIRIAVAFKLSWTLELWIFKFILASQPWKKCKFWFWYNHSCNCVLLC